MIESWSDSRYFLFSAFMILTSFAILELRWNWDRDWLAHVRRTSHWRGRTGYSILAVYIGCAWTWGEVPSMPTVIPLPAFLFFLWCGLSWTWSDAKYSSARFLTQWILTALAAYVTGASLKLTGTVQLVVLCSTAVLALGLLSRLLSGSLFNRKGRFSGLSQANEIARHCTLIILGMLYLHSQGVLAAWLLFLTLSLAVIALGLTRSRTTMLTFLLVGGIYCWLSPTIASLYSWVLALAIHLYLSYLPTFTPEADIEAEGEIEYGLDAIGTGALQTMIAMGRPVDEMEQLQGRRVLWGYVIDNMRRKPWFGHGWGGFWTEERSTSYGGWRPRSAHSLYLDLVLNLGAFGAILYFAMMFSFLQGMRELPDTEAHFVIVFLATHALWGLFESVAIRPGYQAFVLLAMLIAIT